MFAHVAEQLDHASVAAQDLHEVARDHVELFGGEISSNAADYFATGLKGRHHEQKKYEEHKSLQGIYQMPVLEGGKVVMQEVPTRNAMNEILRDEYVADCERAVRRWNKIVKDGGITDFEFALPSRRFNRSMGMYAEANFTPAGEPISADEFEARRDEWLPTESDRAYVRSLMQPVYEPGKFAPWIAPPRKGVKGQGIDFEYVKFTA